MICRGDLFYYDFGDNSGSVQSGERPVLVVQADDYNQNAPTIIVAAVTSVIKKRYLPSHIILGEEFGLKKPRTYGFHTGLVCADQDTALHDGL